MKVQTSLLAFLLSTFFLTTFVSAGSGDTTIVQTFTFDTPGSPKEGKFLFPPASKQFEKILMYYTLKCDPKQNPACGEWDYITFTYLWVSSKRGDSTILDRYELGRFITPYGIGLDLSNGWTWIYDVTDFRPLLSDSVHLTAGNWQELLDMKFVMIGGTPPRDVIKIENLWQGDFPLNDFVNRVHPRTITLDSAAKMFKLRAIVSGHGWDNPTNCAEFCPKIHSVDVNGTTRYNWQIVQECAMNALYPQGGTWIYDRAGWCPGMPVTIREMELTPFITGNTVTLDYNSDPDPSGNYVVESQLVSYSTPNRTLDAAVDDIITPNTYELYRRFNPICGKPKIVIQNCGATTLTNLDITYGPIGGNSNTYHWIGSLAFPEKETIELPSFNWGTWSGSNNFKVTLSKLNGSTDEYINNNIMSVPFETAPVYDRYLIINFLTNNTANENRYQIIDANGNIIFTRSNFLNSTTYRDTLRLPPGCYEFVMYDSGDDGIYFWNHPNKGRGTLTLRLVGGGLYKTLNPDFGKEMRFQFAYSSLVSVGDVVRSEMKFDLYPNPISNNLTVNFTVDRLSPVRFEFYNLLGQKIKEISEQSYDAGNHHVQLDVSDILPGIYFINIITGFSEQRRMISIVR